jgi:hypothetical protein
VSIGFTTRRVANFSSPLVGCEAALAPRHRPCAGCGEKNFTGKGNLIVRYCRPYPRSGTNWNCRRVLNTLCWSLCHWAEFCLSTSVSPSQWHVTNAVYSVTLPRNSVPQPVTLGTDYIACENSSTANSSPQLCEIWGVRLCVCVCVCECADLLLLHVMWYSLVTRRQSLSATFCFLHFS